MAESRDLSVRALMHNNPVRIHPDRTIQDAAELMNRFRVGAVLVADVDNLVGIFTERDFLGRALATTEEWRQKPVREWMSPHPYTIHPDAGWEDAMEAMERLRVRHLPVVEDRKLVGVVTARQLIGQRNEHLRQVVSTRTTELRRAHDELLARDSEMAHYMKAAARLQRHLVLPTTIPTHAECAWGIHYAPLEPLGGDYYDFAEPDADHLGVLVADASGHGIPAAMVAIMASTAFRDTAGRSTSPGAVLAAMNRRLLDLADERYVTAFYGVFDRRSRRFTYANAGHPPPIRYDASAGACMPLSARGFFLGITPEEQYRERTVELNPGDRVCFYTDGVVDCRDPRGASYGTEQLTSAVARTAAVSGESAVRQITDEIDAFRNGAKPIDDRTLLIAEIR